MQPSLRESTEADVKAAIADRSKGEGLFVFEGDELTKAFASDAAEDLRGIGATYYVPGTGAKFTVYTGQDEAKVYEKEFNSDEEKKAALAWAKEARVPLFGQITEENYEIYVDVARNGMFWVCLDPAALDTELTKYVPVFQKAVTDLKGKGREGGKYPMVWIDAKEFEAHAKEELGCTTFPTIVLQKGDLLGDAETTKVDKYVRSFADEKAAGVLDAAAVEKFFADIESGALMPAEEPDELDELDADDVEGEEAEADEDKELDDMDAEL